MIGLRGVGRSFGGTRVLDGIDLDVARGAFVALLGRSGSGKTTLLRIVAGLEHVDRGTVAIDGVDATDLKPGVRKVGFVFQGYALFGHMTVFENVAFGLRVRRRRERLPETQVRERVEALLARVKLGGLGPRLPAQLSGGQRQRVAFARALAVEPRILLLDEPFGALDREVRVELRAWLRQLHDELGITTLFVSHDEEEAHGLADRVVLLDRGLIVRDEATGRGVVHSTPVARPERVRG